MPLKIENNFSKKKIKRETFISHHTDRQIHKDLKNRERRVEHYDIYVRTSERLYGGMLIK